MLASDLNNPECLRGANLTWMLSNHSDPSKIADTLMIDEFYASFKDTGFFSKYHFGRGKSKGNSE